MKNEPSPRARKILYVIDCLDRGGAEQHLALLAPRLKALGWQPVIFCLRRAGVRASELREAGIEVVAPPVEMPEGLAGALLRLPLFTLAAIKLLLVMLRQRPAIAHFFLPAAYLIGAPLARLARVPVRLMSRRSLNRYSQNRPFARRREMALHRNITGVLANSRAIVRELVDEEGCRKEKLGLIYNGVDLTKFEGISCNRGKAGASQRRLRFIIVANLIAYKGHADLLDGLAAVCDRLPDAWELQCVGRDDGCLAALEDQARQLGISGHVKFPGERTGIPDLLAQSDIGILCSHEEGFSNAILEGMAAGLPMVVTDVGGNAEGVVHEKTGFVVPARNPDKLGAAILSLANDPKGRRKMGQAGRKRAMACFDIDACVTRYVRLYEALLRGESLGNVDGVGCAGEHDPVTK